MKKIFVSCLLAVIFFSTAFAQYRNVRTGYEGDYFSLEGALELFKNSYSLNDFERQLNTERNWVNNLDLNYDGQIDYIRVEHIRDGRYHAIVLQAQLGRYDEQDVAVIEIEVLGRRRAILQIVGDEDLYGEAVYVEPIAENGDRRRYDSRYGDYVNVYYWEPVQQIVGPRYQVYASPYRWHYYPTWWSPWVQCSWDIFRPRIVIYHRHYHVVHTHRVVHVHNFYWDHRRYSTHVVRHTNEVRVRNGKKPIHRPDPVVNSGRRSRNDVNSRNDVSGRTDKGTVISRNGARTSTGENTRTTVQSGQDSRKTRTIDSRTSRSNPTTNRSTVSSRKDSKMSSTSRSTAPSRSRSSATSKTAPSKSDRNSSKAPSVQKPSRSKSDRSTTTTRSSSTSSRSKTSVSKSNSRKSTAPKAQPSRSQPSRSATTTRSKASSSKSSSVKSSKSAPAAKPKAKKQTTKTSSARSRRGG